MVGFFIVSYNIFILVYLIHVKLIGYKNSTFPLVQIECLDLLLQLAVFMTLLLSIMLVVLCKGSMVIKNYFILFQSYSAICRVNGILNCSPPVYSWNEYLYFRKKFYDGFDHEILESKIDSSCLWLILLLLANILKWFFRKKYNMFNQFDTAAVSYRVYSQFYVIIHFVGCCYCYYRGSRFSW